MGNINDKIASKVTTTNKNIANKLFSTNEKIADTVITNHNKVADAFVDTFLKKENETTEEAHERLKGEAKNRKAELERKHEEHQHHKRENH